MGATMSYKTAIIGLGHQSIGNYLPGLMDSRFAQLKAVCDVDEAKTSEIANKFAVTGYTDYRKLIEYEPLDFLIVATPHDVYKDVIELACQKGIHILKEKPFARTIQEGLYFNKLCSKSGIHLMTTLQRRFNPIYTTFFQLTDQIGEITFVEAKYTLSLENPSAGWRGDKDRAGGGCLIDMGYHIIDMIIWYFGLPTKVIAEFLSEDTPEETAFLLFAYDSGVYGSITLSRSFPPKTEYIKVCGTRGIIEVERGCIKRFKKNGDVTEVLTRDISWPLAATQQIDYFCKVIKGEVQNIGNPIYHLQHVKFIEACYESKKQGKYIYPAIIGGQNE